MYDVIIIGAGPAGISAGLYAKRSNLNVLILYHSISGLEKASKIDNYYGFPDGIRGENLFYKGIEQAKNLGIEVINEEVTNIEKKSNEFYIVKSNNRKFESKSIIIATGNKKSKPNIVRNR